MPLVAVLNVIHAFVFTTFQVQLAVLTVKVAVLVSEAALCVRIGGLTVKPQPVPHCVMSSKSPPTLK